MTDITNPANTERLVCVYRGGMNVLSLFDGMACGLVALKRAGIRVDNYFASEIDKYAIKIATKNHPEIIQLGNVLNWREWNLPHIDLLIGGSPCQGFSKSGKGLNFDDPRSKLFFEFVNIRNALKPDYWLLENVDMKKEWKDIISNYMGIQPVKINSALVSAQNRIRLYWANWNITQPEDRHIYLKDIIEEVVENKYLEGYNQNYKSQSNSLHDLDSKSHSICAGTHGYAFGYIEVRSLTEARTEEAKQIRREHQRRGADFSLRRAKELVLRADEKSNTLTTARSNKEQTVMIYRKPHGFFGGSHKTTKKSDTVRSAFRSKDNFSVKDKGTYRKLTVTECERLQTLEDRYSAGVSDTQRYKMIGNGWTIDVIAHIFSQMQSGGEIWHKARQSRLFDFAEAENAG